MITEHVMCTGQWTVGLRKRTPQDVLDGIEPWDHLVITNQRVDPARFSDTQMKGLARWSGVITEVPKRKSLEIAGYGLALHLGDTDGVGPVYETAVANTAQGFSHWIADLLPTAITAGAVSAGTGTLTCADIQWITPRQAIDWVCSMFSEPFNTENYEWRINPDGTMDAGPVSDLWITDPASETLPPLLVAKEPGGQPNTVPIPAVKITGKGDAGRRVLRQVVLAGTVTSATTAGTATASHSFKDFHGNALVRTRITQDAKADSSTAERRAKALLEQGNKEAQTWEADLGQYQIQGQIRPGDWILVYDQANGFTDTGCEMDWRGDRIWPATIRVAGWQWSVSEGMGVYHRSAAGVWTDLSDYVQWEPPSTVLYLGDRPQESEIPDLVGLMQDQINQSGQALVTGTNSSGTFIIDTTNLLIKSSNYSAGSTGFAIDGGGNAEFNDIEARGTVYASAGSFAGTLNACTVSANLVMGTGGGIKTASSGGRVELMNASSGYIDVYDSSGNKGQINMSSAHLALTSASGAYIGVAGGAYWEIDSSGNLTANVSPTISGSSTLAVNGPSALYLQKGGTTRIGIGSSVDLNDGSGSCYLRVGSGGVISVNVDGALETVTAGANDSGGSGYKVLRIPN